MTLSEKFTAFRTKMRLDQMPRDMALFSQGSYIAGAQAAFQILAATADLSREDAIVAWKNLQDEIIAAAPAAPPPAETEEPERLVELPPEKKIILVQ